MRRCWPHRDAPSFGDRWSCAAGRIHAEAGFWRRWMPMNCRRSPRGRAVQR